MFNYYARAKLYTSSDRDKLAAFVKKAKEVEIPNYDYTLAINFADAIVNYCNEN